MDCRYFHGRLSLQERKFLNYMLQRHEAETILKSWVEQGCIRQYAGRGVNAEKAEVVRVIADVKGFCRRERVAVSPVDQACAFWQPRESHSSTYPDVPTEVSSECRSGAGSHGKAKTRR